MNAIFISYDFNLERDEILIFYISRPLYFVLKHDQWPRSNDQEARRSALLEGRMMVVSCIPAKKTIISVFSR